MNIDVDEITTKAFKTIESCETDHHLDTAAKYCNLVLKICPFTLEAKEDLKEFFRDVLTNKAKKIKYKMGTFEGRFLINNIKEN